MTFLIEPGLTLRQTNAKPSHAGPKSSADGSGDAFARSLQQDRRTESGVGSEPESQVKTTDTEKSRPRISWRQDGPTDATAGIDATQETNALTPFDEIETDHPTLSDADGRMILEGDVEPGAAELSEQDEDDTGPSLAGMLTAPEETAKLSAPPETSKNITVESASSGNAEVHSDTRPEDSPPAPEVQAMTVQATGQGEAKQGTSRTSDKDTLVKSAIEVAGSAAAKPDVPDAAMRPSVGTPDGGKEVTADDSAKPLDEDATFLTELSDGSLEANPHTGKAGTVDRTSPAPEGNTQLAASALGASPAPQTTSQPAQSPVQMTSTNAMVTASPAETVKIITDAVGSPDDTPDRITVQLDPPELGRVSIDFKFDAHGIQHITVTGETPEAMKQLRLMHFELTQALERSGLSSQSMTFQQQQSGHQQSHTPAPGRLFENTGPATDSSLLASANLTADTIRPARSASGGLDIRL